MTMHFNKGETSKRSSRIALRKVLRNVLLALCVVTISVIIALFPSIAYFVLSILPHGNCHGPPTMPPGIGTASIDRAVELFGDDLLFDRLILEESWSADSSVFVRLEWQEDGQLIDRESWEALRVNLTYSKRITALNDTVALYIFFNEQHPDVIGTDSSSGLDDFFEDDATEAEVNGTSVKIKRLYNEPRFEYSYVARFNNGKHLYYLITEVLSDSDLFTNTLEQLLSQST